MRHICNVTAKEPIPDFDNGKPQEMREGRTKVEKGMFVYIFPL